MEKNNKYTLAKNLSYYMAEKGIDRTQLCDDLGFKYSTVSEWLSAKKYPRMDKIEMLSNYFGIMKSDLIEDKRNTLTPTDLRANTKPVPLSKRRISANFQKFFSITPPVTPRNMAQKKRPPEGERSYLL